MTRAEALAFNAGVRAVLGIAAEAARAIAHDARRTHVGFAYEALRALAQEGGALLLPIDPEQPGTAPVDQPNGPRSPTPVAAEASQ